MARRNPLDLSDLDDPFEPEFHAAVSAAKKRAVVWHGTSTINFWNIVQGGLTYDEARAVWSNTSPGVYVGFSPASVGIYAAHATEAVGGDMIFFVMEVPISMLGIDIDDHETWDRTLKQQARSEQSIPPKYITGVVYPVTDPYQETPVREFIKRVQRGRFADVEGLEPFPGVELPRFARATMDDEEHAVLSYLTDLLNYSEFVDELLQPAWGALQRKVITHLQAVPRSTWLNWNARHWIDFVEHTLGRKLPDDDYVFEEISRDRKWQRPIYEVWKRYGQSEDAFREQRLGKKRR